MKNFLIVLFISLVFQGCGVKMGVVMPMGDGIYTLTGNGRSGFVALGKIRRKVLKEADMYAKESNTTLEVISVNEVKTSFGVWPQIDLTFRIVNESIKVSDPKNVNTKTIIKSASTNGSSTSKQITTKKDKTQKENDKYERLLKLGELKRQGILSDEEFQKEKEKILNENQK